MKLTKKITAMVLCGIMAASSMVGISALAASHTTNVVQVATDGNGVKIYGQASISVSNSVASGVATAYIENGINVPRGTIAVSVGIFDVNGNLIDDYLQQQNSMTNTLSARISVNATTGGNYCGGLIFVDKDWDGDFDVYGATLATNTVS